MLTARIAFFVTVAIMVVFGVVSMPDSTARVGIIACVFAEWSSLWPNESLSNKNKIITYLMSVFDARGQLLTQKGITVPAFTDVWDIAG